MGEPIDPITDPVPGGNCGIWIDPPNTPQFVYVYFWDLVTCPAEVNPAPNLHLFELTQIEGTPCSWKYRSDDSPFEIDFDYAIDGNTWLQMWDKQAHSFFQDFTPSPVPEHHLFTNDFLACPNGHGSAEGFATILWKQAAVDLLIDFNLPTDGQILMEFFTLPDGTPVYKFCNLLYSMNVKFKITP